MPHKMNFTEEEFIRYQRQFSLPSIGLVGQEKLKAARVLCVGLGGIGCPLSSYLVAAGIGQLGIMDSDQVELSNLQRQWLYRTDDVRKNKVDCAQEFLSALNPNVQLIVYPEKITAENADSIIEQYDLIIDGTDNFASRYVINDAAVMQRKSLISASILQHKAQLALFNHQDGACYRCLFPEVSQTSIPNCSEAGVLGATVGVLGSLAANMALNYLLKLNNYQNNELFVFNSETLELQRFSLHKDPDCLVCGKKIFFSKPEERTITSDMNLEITNSQLQTLLAQGKQVDIIDVRELWEREMKSLSDSRHIPLHDMHTYIPDAEAITLVYCAIGYRSLVFTKGSKTAWL